MVTVKEQYEHFPYPARDPAAEARRLISGSPSRPSEMDHFLWGGARDWSQRLRVLIAGGGTGDALIQLAQLMTNAGAPYDMTYVDLSAASRDIAEARARARGLTGITFVTGSLLDAASLGPFDYIDCCGVLHHLPDPDAGFAALRAALAPGGGMGFMVYAPYGRSGVYPLQEAFGALFDGLPPGDRLTRARQIVEGLPKGHPFAANTTLMDHEQSDAGFYDLLLHSQDTPYDVARLLDTCARTGWHLQGFVLPGLYDLSRITDVPAGMAPETALAVAERLRGTIRKHVGYLTPSDENRALPKPSQASLVPRFQLPNLPRVAQMIAQGKPLPASLPELDIRITLPREAAPLIAAADGRRSLAQIAEAAGLDPLRMGALWGKVDREFTAWGLLHYTRFGLP
ncbi:class I SAM-dependent methyltransferase [Sagittula salina]|uniref:Class I SAM-dependent methyltransferase n=1 Tax=Sagittula salina TaxID=2820268 RepID=A0A940MTB0_9RHOB|nr:class I SAM-dependent methyltransferase [Sagittula salina]MBP0482579.1 class I SAM-dependent methyltransferase [Sagittula salina]